MYQKQIHRQTNGRRDRHAQPDSEFDTEQQYTHFIAFLKLLSEFCKLFDKSYYNVIQKMKLQRKNLC